MTTNSIFCQINMTFLYDLKSLEFCFPDKNEYICAAIR